MKQTLIVWPLIAALALVGAPVFAKPDATSAASSKPSTSRVENCSWDRPGHNPFMGDVVAAVDRYSDIPTDVRGKLKQRMAARQYDDIVSIKRDSISGKQLYTSGIRDMHFGTNRVCGTVTRDKWSAQMEERGLVYCEGAYCVLVPTVCRNVSRIDRAPGAAGGGAPEGELAFAPPAAGEAAPETFEGLPPTGAGTATASALPGTGLVAVPGSTPSVVGSSPAPMPSYIGPSIISPPPLVAPGSLPSIPAIPPAVPEPGTWLMMAAGIAMLALIRQRRSAAATQRIRA